MGFFSWFLFLIFHSWYSNMPLISEYWLCIQLFCQIYLLGRVVFGGVYRIFLVHYHVICKQWQFHFLLWMEFGCLLFLFLVWLLWLGRPILSWIGVVREGILVLFLTLVGKVFFLACWVWYWLKLLLKNRGSSNPTLLVGGSDNSQFMMGNSGCVATWWQKTDES